MSTHETDTIGDLRAALDAFRENRDGVAWATFALRRALRTTEDPGKRDSIKAMSRSVLSEHAAGRNSMWDVVEFVIDGLDALDAVIRAEADWVHDPELAADTWAAALAWQLTVHHPESTRDEGLHVCMGLGNGRTVALQWDTAHDLPSFRHVTLSPGALDPGQLNVFAALEGYPGLPEHLETFDEGHVSIDPTT